MSCKYKFRDQQQLYFVTFSVINWIDLFIRNEYKDIMLRSWNHCMNNKGMELYAWCIMTSHIHMIIGSQGEPLEHIMRDMKRHTSEELRRAIKLHPSESRREWLLEMMQKAGKKNSNNISFQLWNQDNHPIELNGLKKLHNCLDYIHHNPVVAGIVENPEDYLYSSARNYFGKQGLIDITFVEPIVM